jgi:hypothetical protein
MEDGDGRSNCLPKSKTLCFDGRAEGKLYASDVGICALGCLVLLAIGVIPVDAGIRASFSLDQSTWNATHIVLVQTTAKDGLFSVVKSCKGDLKPGDSLEISELRPDDHAVPISNGQIGIGEEIPRQPVASQMILVS